MTNHVMDEYCLHRKPEVSDDDTDIGSAERELTRSATTKEFETAYHNNQSTHDWHETHKQENKVKRKPCNGRKCKC